MWAFRWDSGALRHGGLLLGCVGAAIGASWVAIGQAGTSFPDRYDKVCIVTFYEGAPRAPLSVRLPRLGNQHPIGSTPPNHVSLIFAHGDTSTIVHVGKDALSLSKTHDHDHLHSEYLFAEVPSGYTFCSESLASPIGCAATETERGQRYCAPLFIASKGS
ncbi:hypothetical protein [Enterovirga rhinocerotis]|uniref:Uncharacterized protein n=1 Tax=Enterovirga rhinocerotis TaxID=1339210 RepID=A0A4R7BVY5_9HYPH|nr:hypothetical protein [Enterovirga rhinocerotis]TDR90020.1 hypothetical protein EV668_2858 [Enterovirga rhinocerotis]